ncbi:DUF881 domain-containing protein [Pseudonocardiaceae bacterium YIM PH 21723]|nr:DUF881 domain-containing protein [Pseudonocardiaceae bacterium YIM PH 21723]
MGQKKLVNALVAVLCVLLGVALVTQVRRTEVGDTLADQRPQDLVVLLDGLQRREAALRKEITDSEDALHRLRESGDRSAAALEEARQRTVALGVLAGTVPAAGPGLRLTISDPSGQLNPELLLNVLQELRGAGAEAVQIGSVRIGVDSAFTGDSGQITLDGVKLTQPYQVVVIGDPPTMDAAINIPGGVIDAVERKNGKVVSKQEQRVEITVLRPPREPRFAKPAN